MRRAWAEVWDAFGHAEEPLLVTYGIEAPTGPLMFQGNHGPVAYRNIRVWPR